MVSSLENLNLNQSQGHHNQLGHYKQMIFNTMHYLMYAVQIENRELVQLEEIFKMSNTNARDYFDVDEK